MNPARLPSLAARVAPALLLVLAMIPAGVRAERIKDLAGIDGVRTNQLVGYGLVIGLAGTGDQTIQAPFTVQSLQNMLIQLGITVPQGVQLQLNNVAAVMVTAELPPFSRRGQNIDVTVSSIANAKSLRGGTLVMTPLKGADGSVYALAQGNLVVGGFDAEGADGSRITANIPSVGRIPAGATVERAGRPTFGEDGVVTLTLNQADFTTSMRMTQVINDTLGAGTARALDAGAVQVRMPEGLDDKVAFVSALHALEVTPGEAPARVIVSARTGTVIIGQQVRISPAAVSHGSLVVSIREDFGVSQPQPFSEGETVVVPRSEIQVSEGGAGSMFKFDTGVTLDSLVEAVNRVGAAPSDLVAILQALHQAGALHAELVVI
ncbi:MAG: flagellar basal body P-ring protein FlgI [Pseudomonadales bacterium]|nr:flagellar basal body P-ring protein FlgI [Pseudomonadales bacterium]